jgi:hypothetical protein
MSLNLTIVFQRMNSHGVPVQYPGPLMNKQSPPRPTENMEGNLSLLCTHSRYLLTSLLNHSAPFNGVGTLQHPCWSTKADCVTLNYMN